MSGPESGPKRGLTLADVRRIAAIGEGQYIEFKLRVPDGRRLAKEMVAFANSGGGQLLLGVGDDGEVTGLRDPLEEIFSLDLAVRTHCQPLVEHTVERISVSRKREVIVIGIPESATKPHFVIEPEPGTRKMAYVRVRDMSLEASREAVRLMRSRADSDTRFEFGQKELLLMRYLDEHHRVTVSQFARLADIPARRASQTLVLLARARILTLHSDPEEDYFTLSRNRAA
jgi:schlafen family protein